MEDRLKSMNNPSNQSGSGGVSGSHRASSKPAPETGQSEPTKDDQKTNCVCQRLSMYVLDISQVLETQVVTWMDVRSNASLEAPDETILYSLTLGRSELILFGGIQKDVSSMTNRNQTSSAPDTVSNSVFYLTPPS